MQTRKLEQAMATTSYLGYRELSSDELLLVGGGDGEGGGDGCGDGGSCSASGSDNGTDAASATCSAIGNTAGTVAAVACIGESSGIGIVAGCIALGNMIAEAVTAQCNSMAGNTTADSGGDPAFVNPDLQGAGA